MEEEEAQRFINDSVARLGLESCSRAGGNLLFVEHSSAEAFKAHQVLIRHQKQKRKGTSYESPAAKKRKVSSLGLCCQVGYALAFR